MKRETLEKIQAKRHERQVLGRRPTPAEIRSIRELAGLSGADFGAALEPPVRQSTVSRWEKGTRLPGPEHSEQLIALAGEIRKLVA